MTIPWRWMILLTFLMPIYGLGFAFTMRQIVFSHAFFDMSKTARKKIHAAVTRRSEKIFLTYPLQYNYRGRTIYCFLCYHIYIVGVVLFLCVIWLVQLVGTLEDSMTFSTIGKISGVIILCAPFASMLSGVIPHRAKKKMKQAQEEREVELPYVNIEKGVYVEDLTIKEPRVVLLGGIILAIVFGAFIALKEITQNSTSDWWVDLCCGGAVLLGIYLTLDCVYWRIQVHGDFICYSPFLTKPKTFTFKEITRVKIKSTWQGQKLAVYKENKKIFAINLYSKGYDEFLFRIARAGIEVKPFRW